eukprot:scaffold18398_cov63-Phaeocystis_antarctica.AAC.1
MLPCASLWAAACDPHGIPPSHGVWTRETRVEGRRRPKKAEVADVVAICVQTSDRPIVVVLIPQRRDTLTNSIMKGIAWLKKPGFGTPLPRGTRDTRPHAQCGGLRQTAREARPAQPAGLSACVSRIYKWSTCEWSSPSWVVELAWRVASPPRQARTQGSRTTGREPPEAGRCRC